MDVGVSCRMCAGIADPGVSLLEPTQQRLAEWVENNLGMTISSDNGYPTRVCMSCMAIINRWVMFRRRCKKAAQVFTNATRSLEDTRGAVIEAPSVAAASFAKEPDPETPSCEESLSSLIEMLAFSYPEEDSSNVLESVPTTSESCVKSASATTETMLDKWLQTGKLSQKSSSNSTCISLTKQIIQENVAAIEINHSASSISCDKINTVSNSDKESTLISEIPLKNLRVNLSRLVLTQDMLQYIRQQNQISSQQKEKTTVSKERKKSRNSERGIELSSFDQSNESDDDTESSKEEKYSSQITARCAPEFIPVEIQEPKSEIRPQKFGFSDLISSLNHQQKQNTKFKKGQQKTRKAVNHLSKNRTVQRKSWNICNNKIKTELKTEPTSDASDNESATQSLLSGQNEPSEKINTPTSLLDESSSTSTEFSKGESSVDSSNSPAPGEDPSSPAASETSEEGHRDQSRLGREPSDISSRAATQLRDQLTADASQQQDLTLDTSNLDDSPDDTIPCSDKARPDDISVSSAIRVKPSANYEVQVSENANLISPQSSIQSKSNQKSKSTLECNICNKILYNPSHIKRHKKLVHKMQINIVEKEKTKACNMCDKKYVSIKYLKKHIINFHINKNTIKTKVKIYNCSICNKKYTNNYGLKNHVRKFHTKKNLIKCDICHKILINNATLKSHMQIHSDPKYECILCNIKFKQRAGLYNHNQHCHVNTDKPFNCYTCSKRFKTKQSMIEHSKTHLPPSYKCIPCNRYFTQSTGLAHHNKRHHNNGERPFKCDKCSKTFTTRHGLTEHKKIHGEAKYCCEICGLKFKQITGLGHHRQGFHAVLRPHKCLQCPATFKTVSGLTEHKKLHGEAKYCCEICGKMFKQSTTLKLHKQSVHSVLRPHKCLKCPATFKTVSGLTEHNKVHGEAKYCYDICRQKFKQKII